MVENIVEKMTSLVNELKESINQDIIDIKAAKHEELLKRNDRKHILIEEITNLKVQLNQELVKKIQEGVDVNIYRAKVDKLEANIKDLNVLNKKLSAIVLPMQDMYKELVTEFSSVNGGRIFDIKA